MPNREQLLEFAAWCPNTSSATKGEAQIFLEHPFQAFGHAGGLKEAGATLQWRVSKADGGTSFADLVGKPVVLIEMKKRGEDLQKHYRQAFDYWTRLVPKPGARELASVSLGSCVYADRLKSCVQR